MTFSQGQIKQIIPHRDPFLLIDEITECTPGVSAEGKKFMAEDSFWFAGHFPDYPVTPGVLMVEMAAQVGAVSLLSLPENKGKLALFAGINSIKFKRQVRPNDTLDISCTITKQKFGIGYGDIICKVGDEIAVKGEIMFALQ